MSLQNVPLDLSEKRAHHQSAKFHHPTFGDGAILLVLQLPIAFSQIAISSKIRSCYSSSDIVSANVDRRWLLQRPQRAHSFHQFPILHLVLHLVGSVYILGI